ncbi:MAG TPA: hypothetical protein VGE14_05470, partial [Marmoricola sp.]
NVLFVASIPLLVGVWVLWARRSWSGAGPRLSPRVVRAGAIAYAVLAMVFTVYRNTPWGRDFYVT